MLKTGLAGGEEAAIDELENEALARGWRGAAWQEPLKIKEVPRSIEQGEALRQLEAGMEGSRKSILPPFDALDRALGRVRRTGAELAGALREFWEDLEIESQLTAWAERTTENEGMPAAAHATVWEQMNGWLADINLAFPDQPLTLREWLPILEAGLGQLTVGLIPPALDQVLVGAPNRSRNPDIRFAILLGLNETVFPAPPERSTLLNENDRSELEKQNLLAGSTSQYQLGRERYYVYVACTRARERLLLAYALSDAEGSPLNPSPFLSQVRNLFPTLITENFAPPLPWQESERLCELVSPLLRMRSQGQIDSGMEKPPGLTGYDLLVAELNHFRIAPFRNGLIPSWRKACMGRFSIPQ